MSDCLGQIIEKKRLDSKKKIGSVLGTAQIWHQSCSLSLFWLSRKPKLGPLIGLWIFGLKPVKTRALQKVYTSATQYVKIAIFVRHPCVDKRQWVSALQGLPKQLEKNALAVLPVQRFAF